MLQIIGDELYEGLEAQIPSYYESFSGSNPKSQARIAPPVQKTACRIIFPPSIRKDHNVWEAFSAFEGRIF